MVGTGYPMQHLLLVIYNTPHETVVTAVISLYTTWYCLYQHSPLIRTKTSSHDIIQKNQSINMYTRSNQGTGHTQSLRLPSAEITKYGEK